MNSVMPSCKCDLSKSTPRSGGWKQLQVEARRAQWLAEQHQRDLQTLDRIERQMEQAEPAEREVRP